MKYLLTLALLLSTVTLADPVCPTGNDDDDILDLYRANNRQDEQLGALNKEMADLKIQVQRVTTTKSPEQSWKEERDERQRKADREYLRRTNGGEGVPANNGQPTPEKHREYKGK